MRMNKKFIISTLAITTANTLPLASFANPEDHKAMTGPVISANIGYAKANADFKSSEIKKGNLFYGATVGFDFALAPYLTIGPEMGLFYGKSLSKYTEGNDNQKVNNLIVPVLAKIKFLTPVGFNIFAKAGVSYVHPSVEKSGENTTKVNWDNSWNFTAAGGIGYQIRNINIFAEYTRIFGKKNVTINNNQGTGYASDIDAITVGVSFIFGSVAGRN